jgi:hypothetical protein
MHVTPRGPAVAGVAPVAASPTAPRLAEVAPFPPATGTAALEDLPPIPAATAAHAEATAPALAAAPPAPAKPAPEPPAPVVAANEAPPAGAHASSAVPVPTKGRADLIELATARDAAKDHPSDAHALKAWALAAQRAGALREARHAGEAWALRDDGTEPRVFLASVLDATGHRGDAKALLAEYLELHPDAGDARRMQARLGDAPPPKAERVVHKTHDR